MLKKLREDSWGKDCKVIVLTLVEEEYHIAQAVESNVLGYIVKTNYSLEGLVEQVQSMLGGI